MNGPAFYTKGGKRVQSSSFELKSLRVVVAPLGLSSQNSHLHGSRGTWGKLSVRTGDDPTLEPRAYMGSFLGPASEVPGITASQ